jgi:UDP-N-acetylmuramoyl-tripeptide--D-alanyl-D-alanine ligase
LRLFVDDILRVTGGRLIQGEIQTFFEGVSTDSRTVKEGDLFVALKGDRFDGHAYALEALEKKAAGVLLEEEKAPPVAESRAPSKTVITVKDTLRALGDLAREHRRKVGTPVVALTGSNGKTTTKEMISACLETTIPVLKTKGNLNNLIGLPLTLLRLTGKERVAVVEMGMSVPGEIRRLTEIAEPNVGLITNIERVHLEGLGTLERLQEEKGELFRRMRRDGTIVVNRDDPRVVEVAEHFAGRRITFGMQGDADVTAHGFRRRGAEGITFTVVTAGEEMEIHLSLIARHFVANALAATAVAVLFGVGLKKIKEALEQIRPSPMRMEICPLPGKKTLINDTYNANPRSMEAALETLAEVKGAGRAIAVLGDMLELGAYSEEGHRQVGQRAGELSIDGLIAVGQKASRMAESAIEHGLSPDRVKAVTTREEALAVLRSWLRDGDWILIKGSRGMAMEKMIPPLMEERT